MKSIIASVMTAFALFGAGSVRAETPAPVTGAFPFKVKIDSDLPDKVLDQEFKFVLTPVSAIGLIGSAAIMTPEQMPMPATKELAIPVRTVVEAGGLYGWGAQADDNPWPLEFTQEGFYTYAAVPADDSAMFFTTNGNATVVMTVRKDGDALTCLYGPTAVAYPHPTAAMYSRGSAGLTRFSRRSADSTSSSARTFASDQTRWTSTRALPEAPRNSPAPPAASASPSGSKTPFPQGAIS